MQFNDFKYFCIIMLEKLKEYIAAKSLIMPNNRLLLAVSAGLDSMVMLHLFQQLPYSISVAHVNFGLRGEESEGDEVFIRDYCEKHSIPIYTKKVDTYEYKATHKLSVQMAARTLRYTWFHQLLASEGIDKLMVAQHTDDSIETTFINIIRGTGIAGLKGVVSNEIALRPMLCFSRKEILAYALAKGIEWREDSSNKKDDYLRNKLRNKILPLFDEVSDTWRENLLQLQTDMEESNLILNKYYEEHIAEIFRNNQINIQAVSDLPFGRWMLRKLLKTLGFSHDTITDIEANLDIQKGKYFESEEYRIRKQENYFSLEKKEDIGNDFSSIFIHIEDQKLTIEGRNIGLEIIRKDHFDRKFIPSDVYMDADTLAFPLHIRKWQAGDWFVPLGMKGKKKLSDYFVDRKFTIQQKENTFVIVSGDNIVCILGHQTDERYKVTDETTTIYHIKYING